MRVEPSDIAGLFLVTSSASLDSRGSFERLFCAFAFAEAGVPFNVTQSSLSRTPARGTLRGLHWQESPHGETKFVRCLEGVIFDVAVDIRPSSPSYRSWRGFELSSQSGHGLLMSPGFAHGFLTLTDNTVVAYAMDAAYAPASARGARYDDPAFGIAWPAMPEMIGISDLSWPAFAA